MKSKKIYSCSYYNISNMKYEIVVYIAAFSKAEAIKLATDYIIDDYSFYPKSIAKIANSMNDLEYDEQRLFIGSFAQFEAEPV